MMKDSIDFLVQATMELNDQGKKENRKDDFLLNSESDYQNVPSSPGVVYKIEHNESTFCVRCASSPNIKKTIIEIERGDEKLLTKLRIDELAIDSDYELLRYFPTEYKEIADLICEHVGNKRVPIFEERMLNLSDPGFSWWGIFEEDSIRLYFSAPSLTSENLVQLGPIYDPYLAEHQFRKMTSFFELHFELAHFESSNKGFVLKAKNPDNPRFCAFKNLLLKGGTISEMRLNNSNTLDSTSEYFLNELFHLRSFWLDLLSEVKHLRKNSKPFNF